MRMFDTFYGTYTCPKCGKSVDFEEQSNDVIFYNASAYMEYKGYKGTIEIDQEANILYGHLLIPNAIVGYDGAAPREFIQAFKDAVDDVIESP